MITGMIGTTGERRRQHCMHFRSMVTLCGQVLISRCIFHIPNTAHTPVLLIVSKWLVNTYTNTQVTQQWCIWWWCWQTLWSASGTWAQPLPPSTSLLPKWSSGLRLKQPHSLHMVLFHLLYQYQSQTQSACRIELCRAECDTWWHLADEVSWTKKDIFTRVSKHERE